jgi:putative SOS response-associated peptidase YedK
MCGRFELSAPQDKIENKFKVSLAGMDYQPRINIAPHQGILAITFDDKSNYAARLLYWGFIPSWVKDFKTEHKPINARAETIATNAYFRHAFKRGRCLIPATAFYEWDKNTKPKTPYRFYEPQQELFAFAGLWNTWQDPEGNALDNGTIITTQSNDKVSWLHDRMPVILREQDWRPWLAGELNEFKTLEKETLENEKTSPAINNPRFSG